MTFWEFISTPWHSGIQKVPRSSPTEDTNMKIKM